MNDLDRNQPDRPVGQKVLDKDVSEEAHPNYALVFIILAVFTALEVGASYLPGGIRVPVLVVLAATKAALVLLYFMHLKFDSRVYSMPMILAAILAIPIILVIVLVMPLLVG